MQALRSMSPSTSFIAITINERMPANNQSGIPASSHFQVGCLRIPIGKFRLAGCTLLLTGIATVVAGMFMSCENIGKDNSCDDLSTPISTRFQLLVGGINQIMIGSGLMVTGRYVKPDRAF